MALSAVPGAGFHCQDVLNGGELFLMDLAMSQNVPKGNAALATGTMPLGEYWMTGGAGLSRLKALTVWHYRLHVRVSPPGPLTTSLTKARKQVRERVGVNAAGLAPNGAAAEALKSAKV